MAHTTPITVEGPLTKIIENNHDTFMQLYACGGGQDDCRNFEIDRWLAAAER
jgi:hypothetical protein